MKNIFKISILFAFLLVTVVSVQADPDAPEWVDFYGLVTLDGGSPAPVGTVVEAYDPDGILCGIDTVINPGAYGFLHVYRDDVTTSGIDEGCDPGDTVFFKVNGIDANFSIVSGEITWTSNGDQNEVTLSQSTTQTVSFSIVDTPNDTLGAPGHTIRFTVVLQNTGDGLDFYAVDAPSDTSTNNAWTSTNQDTLSYADPMAQTSVWFDITLPVFGGGSDTVHVIHYTVWSEVDNSVLYEDSVTISKTITDVDDNPWANLPNQLNLYQNYPNPFNPVTSISFELPRQSSVRLEIYNTLGQLVDVISHGYMPAGINEIEYDASELSSGVYFYRLVTDDNSLSKKMVLLK